MPSASILKLRSALQIGGGVNFVGRGGGLQEQVEVLVGQGKLLLGNCSRLFHSERFSTFEELQVLLRPGTVCAGSSDFLSANQKRNLSVVGTVSRTISIPSVSGPSLQVCGYHIDQALSESSYTPVSSKCQTKSMNACGSGTAFRDCRIDNVLSRNRQFSSSVNNGSVAYGHKKLERCRMAVMCLNKRDKPENYQIYGFLMYNAAKRWFDSGLSFCPGWREVHSSCPSCFAAGTAPDVSFNRSSCEQQLNNSGESSELKIPSGRALKLVSGSCYLPHPNKEETGGEDAHFICADAQAIGVADGVGGWADLGIDAGQYSRELMSQSVAAIEEEPKGAVDPTRVLEKAHSSTKAKGSSTACIIALTDQGLHAINLGDSGFMVVRDGCTVFRSPVQQHDFNFTYQLESGDNGDMPSSGQVFTVPVAPGDVVIAGTDGLFDNLYNNEITAVVVHAIRAGFGPQVTAQKIAALARQRAQDKNRQTPFSTAAQDAGFRYYGGKLDDITVVVSYITGSKEVEQS